MKYFSRVYENFIVIDAHINQIISIFDELSFQIKIGKEYILSDEFTTKIEFVSLLNHFIKDMTCYSLDIMSKNTEYKDDDVKREIETVLEFTNNTEYNLSMLKSAISQNNHYSINDALDYLDRIYKSVMEITNTVSGVCHSDYCFVERGLLKKEEVYSSKSDSKEEEKDEDKEICSVPVKLI